MNFCSRDALISGQATECSFQVISYDNYLLPGTRSIPLPWEVGPFYPNPSRLYLQLWGEQRKEKKGQENVECFNSNCKEPSSPRFLQGAKRELKGYITSLTSYPRRRPDTAKAIMRMTGEIGNYAKVYGSVDSSCE